MAHMDVTVPQIFAKVGELTIVNEMLTSELELHTMRADRLDDEVVRLRKLCAEHGIDFAAPQRPTHESPPT